MSRIQWNGPQRYCEGSNSFGKTYQTIKLKFIVIKRFVIRLTPSWLSGTAAGHQNPNKVALQVTLEQRHQNYSIVHFGQNNVRDIQTGGMNCINDMHHKFMKTHN